MLLPHTFKHIRDTILLAVVNLFVEVPHLAQHLLDLSLSHKVGVERFSIFKTLFEVAAGEAGGAEDYRLGCRLRTTEQCESAVGARADNKMVHDGHDDILNTIAISRQRRVGLSSSFGG